MSSSAFRIFPFTVRDTVSATLKVWNGSFLSVSADVGTEIEGGTSGASRVQNA